MADVAGSPVRAYSIRGRRFALPELLVSGAGLLMLGVGWLPWYGYDADGWHPRYSGYQSGSLAFFPVLITVVVAGTVLTSAWSGTALPRFASGRFTWLHVFAGLDGVAAALIMAFWLTIPPLAGASVEVRVGVYAGLLVALAQAAGCWWGARSDRAA